MGEARDQITRVIIVHGFGNKAMGNWFPWLKNELEKKGYEVIAPDFPNSDNPIQSEWVDKLSQTVGEAERESTILVGHSLGATVILRYLETLPPGQHIKAAILVATPTKTSVHVRSHVRSNLEPIWNFYDQPFDWQKIKFAAKKWFIIGSDNDPYIPFEEIEYTSKMLGQKLIFFHGHGHFNITSNPKYKEFPYLLKIFDEIEK